jgi:prevent-host-death family protein
MKTVSAREANQRFSKLLAAAEAGEEIVVTRRGRPVVRIVAIAAGTDAKRKRDAAFRRFERLMSVGLPMGGLKVDRQALYDERMEELEARRKR